MESKIQTSFTRTNVKNTSLAVIVFKLVCVDDKFSGLLTPYLDEDTVYNFYNSMLNERKYCVNVMKKTF